ncbi:hypothetical protein RB213_001122 [Colletotrichum asianum]
MGRPKASAPDATLRLRLPSSWLASGSHFVTEQLTGRNTQRVTIPREKSLRLPSDLSAFRCLAWRLPSPPQQGRNPSLHRRPIVARSPARTHHDSYITTTSPPSLAFRSCCISPVRSVSFKQRPYVQEMHCYGVANKSKDGGSIVL